MRKGLKVFLILLLILAVLAAGFWYFCVYRSSLPAKLYTAAADYFAGSGNDPLAARLYAKALDRTPGDISLAVTASDAYCRCNNFTRAEYVIVRAISHNPDALEGYLALSALYVRQDKLLDAERLITNCSNPEIREELSALRPHAPVIQPQGGFSLDPIEFSLSYSDGLAYLSLDEEYPTLESSPYDAPILLDYGVTDVTAIVVGANGLVSPVSSARFTVCGEVEPVEFPDLTFDEMIRDLLGKGRYEDILTSELWGITELRIPEGVKDLTGLSHFVALTSLTATACEADFCELAGLPLLAELNLSGSPLSEDEIAAIGTLTSLTSLDISGCDVGSIDALAALNGLTVLNASGNRLSDITAVSAMPNLHTLRLENNAISSITPLAACAQLKILSLSGNSVGSLGALSANTALVDLGVSGCGLSDLSPLSNKAGLIMLDASNNAIRDFSGLTACTALQTLNLAGNRIEDAAPAARLPALQVLNLAGNEIEDCPRFPAGHPLQSLDLSQNTLEEVEPLNVLSYLSYLNVSENRLTDLSSLSKMSTLSRIDAYKNPLVGVYSLEQANILVGYDPGYELPEELLEEDETEAETEEND